MNQTKVVPSFARRKLESASSLRAIHWVLISLSLFLTLLAWYYAKSELHARLQTQFDRSADHVVELVQERMQKYEDALWAGVALIHTMGDDVTFDKWNDYAETIAIKTKYPGINGIGVIHSLSKEQLADYQAAQRLRRPDFQVHPSHDGRQILPISYIIPVIGNEKAVGLDMAHEQNRFTAAQKCRDRGTSQITAPIQLVQDHGKTPGFLFYAPFYRGGTYEEVADRQEHFAGMVYAPFVVKNLMQGTLEKLKRRVGIRLVDGDDILYDEHVSSESDFDPNPIFKRSTQLPMHGRMWTFDIWSTNSFRQEANEVQPLVVLIGGVILDLLIVYLFTSVSRASHRALSYADSITNQLEENAKTLEAKQIELIANAKQLTESHAILAQLEQQLRSIFESAPVAMVMVDHEGRIVLVNGELQRMFGYSRDELISKPIEALLPERFRSQHPGLVKQFFFDPLARNIGKGRDLFGLRQNGSEFPLELGSRPVDTEDGSFVLSAIVDITDRKRAEAELLEANATLKQTQAVYRVLIDESANFVGLTSTDGVLLDANRTALSAAGVSPEDVLGRPFWETPWWTHSRELQDRLKQAIQTSAAGTGVEFEATHLGADAEVINVAFSLKPVKDEHGETLFLIPEGRNITVHKRREAEYELLLDKLSKSNKELEQFAYIASHDLQEPLRKVISFTHILREEYGHKLDEDAQKYIDFAADGALRMRSLIVDLLGYSRIATQAKALKHVNAASACAEAIDNLQSAIEDCDAIVTFDHLPNVRADHTQLVSLFQNLIGNAIKYRASSRRVQIHVGVDSFRDRHVFYVEDNGIGIAEEYFQKIFEIFRRLHSRDEYSGTGIGLALCQRIVDRLGGCIWVESQTGQGSKFYFSLPVLRTTLCNEAVNDESSNHHALA